MHFCFIPYGKEEELQIFFRDLKAQKHFLPFKNNKKIKGTYIEGQLRRLPFGIYEYVFPKEDKDRVLRSFGAKNTTPKAYNIPKTFLTIIRKTLNLKKIPKYDEKIMPYLWIKQNISIISLGMREDGNIYDKLVKATHEAI